HYLRRYGSRRKRWDAPATDATRPEAEWGFAPELGEDVERFARRTGRRVRRIRFRRPEDLSPWIADLHRWWNARDGVGSGRLLVESFMLLDPSWVKQTGAIPFWLSFPTDPAAAAIEAYLKTRPPFSEIGLMLFSHGVDSVGLVPLSRWRSILRRATQRGTFVGVDEHAYPRDFATVICYHADLGQGFAAEAVARPPLTLGDVDAFLREESLPTAVNWG
ncbi:MAG: hypothetical protein ACREQY_09790, partial [Candidatus Binatia bacterium]